MPTIDTIVGGTLSCSLMPTRPPRMALLLVIIAMIIIGKRRKRGNEQSFQHTIVRGSKGATGVFFVFLNQYLISCKEQDDQQSQNL